MKLYKLLSIVFVFVACKPVSNEKVTNKIIPGIDKAEMKRTLNSIVYAFPSSKELLQYIDDSKFEYNHELINNPKSANKYLSSEKQALNIGIYITNMGYTGIMSKTRVSSAFMEPIIYLSGKLRIEYPENDPVFAQLEKSQDNLDSLKIAIKKVNDYMVDWLVENSRENVFAIVSLGSFIEFLHIILHHVGDYNENNLFINKITEIKYAFENLRDYINELDSEYAKSCASDELSLLSSIFDEVSGSNEPVKVARSNEGKLSFSGGQKLEMTEDQYNKLIQMVRKMRAEIISIN